MLRVFHRLTKEHIEVSDSAKMRNFLAEDCLSKDMLNLMICYKRQMDNGEHLNASIELLRRTSILVEIFNDNRPIGDMNDPRIEELKEVKN